MISALAAFANTPINTLLDSTQSFQRDYIQTFASIGINMYNAIATILIVWAGIQIAMSGSVDYAKLTKFIFFLAFGLAICKYYASPIPGIGYSLVDLVLKQASYLSTTIDQRAFDRILKICMDRIEAMPFPTLFSPVAWFWCIVHYVTWGGLIVVAVVVIAYGQIAVAVCVMLGPIFVPFFLVPKMDWLFWGWFKAFLQFAFYRVVASAVVLIVSEAVMNCMPDAKLLTHGDVTTNFAQLFMTPVIGAVALLMLLKIPTMTASIFSGSAGGGDGGIVDVASSVGSKAGSAVSGAMA